MLIGSGKQISVSTNMGILVVHCYLTHESLGALLRSLPVNGIGIVEEDTLRRR